MTEKSSLNCVIGYSDTETVKLDFDDTPLGKVKYWALRTCNWFELGGFVVLKSSTQCYHVVFNHKVSWTENMRIVAWVALETKNDALKKWHLMQCIKRSSTLRVSEKKEKAQPRIAYRYGKQDKQVNNYLKTRVKIKKIIGKAQRIHVLS